MAMHQDIKQEQALRLSQHLSQQQVRFVRLLEMNDQEAEDAVNREVDSNEALEVVEAPPADVPLSPSQEYRIYHSGEQSRDWTPLAADDSMSLSEYLEGQLGELHISSSARELAIYIIGNIDSNGYLQRSPQAMIDDLAFASGIDVSPEQMQQALQLVQSLEPAGVGSMNLQQALELQLMRLPSSTERTDALEIVRHGYDDFAMKHTPRLVSRLKIPAARVEKALALIKTLNPKPGAAIGTGHSDMATAVVPDFQIDVSESGQITVSYPSRIPTLAIQESFEQAAARLKGGDKSTTRNAEFILSRYNDARDFIRILTQRRDTLYAVVTAIVKLQKPYLLSCDEKDLQPLTLKDVASLTGMDLSTVSRACSGKYIATPCGIKPLKFFFSEGYESADGGQRISARSVQAALRSLVEDEDKRHPLSDEALCARLSEQGYDVSRRTVAKYRDRLGIPVARLRKQMKL